MKNYIWIITIFVGLHSLPSAEVLAGRGGGRMGGARARVGGGGARAGGGGFSGGARPNFSAHAPSMSRAAPSINRSNFNRPNVSRPSINRPSSTRPQVSRPNNISRPNTGGLNRPSVGNGNRLNLGSGTRPSIGGPHGPTFGDKRPSIGQLDDFLGIPGGSGNRPTTLPSKVPGKGLGEIGAKLPERLPNKLPGDIGSNRPNRPGVGGIRDRDININGGDRVNIGNRVGDNNIDSIRNKWSNNVNRPFGDGSFWDSGFRHHPSHWHWQHGWHRYPPHWCWRVGSWATVGAFFAWNWATPVVYDYGSTVVYRDNIVYVQDQQVATADEYYEQASTIAQSVPQTADPETVEWMPLGVFAISAEGATDTGLLLQLAVSKEGIIAGTFYNETTDSSRPVEGTVDRESQRAAWKFADGKNEEVVMETVIHNLTEDESTALVHFGGNKQENWTMVRMETPKEQ